MDMQTLVLASAEIFLLTMICVVLVVDLFVTDQNRTLTFSLSRSYLIQSKLMKGEFFLLSLFGLLGILIMISANSLLIMYLGLETLALSLYALVAFERNSRDAAESAMKYFILGAIASGSLLYGISWVYGVTGAIEFNEIFL